MTEYDDGPRKLPWEVRDPIAYSANTEDDGDCEPSSFVWPEDSDERVLIPFYLSLNEYNVLANCIDVGSDLAYGADALKVTWLWLRNMRCNVANWCEIIAAAINDCDDVRDAIWGAMQAGIGNVPSVQNAFREWWLADQQIRDTMDQRYNTPSLNDSVSGANMLKPDQCVDDFIFNQCVVLVDLLNDISIDIFEAVEVGTNQLERWAIVTSAVPATGQVIPVDEGLQFVDQLIEEVYDDYIGAFDTALRNQIACDIFCIAQNECTLSLDQCIAYYESKVGSLSIEDPVTLLQDIVTFINTGDFPGDLPVYAMHLLSLTLMKLAQDVFGIDFAALYLQVIAAGDTPNNDWETVCPDCPTEVCQDMTVSANNWFGGLENGAPTTDFGIQINGEGLAPNQTTNPGGFNMGVDAGDMPAGTITGITFYFNEPVEDFRIARWGSDDFKVWPGGPVTEMTFSSANTTGYFPFDSALASVRATTSTNIASTSMRIVQICFQIG